MRYISVTNFLGKFPEYKNLYGHLQWDINRVGDAYDYEESILENNLMAFNGVFMELFIRKHLCQKFRMPCRDDRTERLLWHNAFSNDSIEQTVRRAYDVYENPNSQAIDIIEEIKIVALSQRLSHDEDMEDFYDILDMEVNRRNLEDVMNFLNEMPYETMYYKRPCDLMFDDCVLRGVPDYIFDNKIFCQITTSMYEDAPMEKLPQIVFYILGHYGRCHYPYRTVKEYMILMYNPLLGLTYKTYLKLTPSEFYKVVVERVENSINTMFTNGWF